MNSAVEPKAEIPEGSSERKSAKSVGDRIGLPTHQEISPEARASLERLLSSASVARAPRLRAVLKFLIDAMLEGRVASLNEQVIGETVFERPAGYNPADDNIVRVTIRHLRERIEEFYRTEGSGEKYVLDIPKGKYVPILTIRNAAVSLQSDTQSLTPVPGIIQKDIRKTVLSLIPWVLVSVLGVSAAIFGYRLYKVDVNAPSHKQNGLVTVLLGNGLKTTVVVTDSNLQAYREIFRKTVTLDAYVSRSYAQNAGGQEDIQMRGVWRYIGETPQTSLTSSIIAGGIQVAAAPNPIEIKHPHDLSMQDFQRENFILLGGPWIDPWGQLFEDRLNFRIVPLEDDPARSAIHNRRPGPSEPTIFLPHQEGNLSVNYVRIAVVRNLANTGYVILLGATSEEALAAGGKFLIDEQKLRDVMQSFKVSTANQLPPLEVVLEVRGLQAVPESIRIVAQRVVELQS